MNDQKAEANKTEKQEPKKDQRELLGLEPVTTEHKLALKGRELKYTATAGVIPLKDDKGETEEGGFRCKLIELAPDGSQFKLFMRANHPVAGYTSPQHIAGEIFEVAGPFPEYESLHTELFQSTTIKQSRFEIEKTDRESSP